MNESLRTRLPWVLWAIVMAILVLTLVLVGLNGDFHNDAFFIPLAILMMVGYSTVGALLAARLRRNPIGWLMMLPGAGFLAAAFTSEYVTWALQTSPGSHPLVDAAIAVNNGVFIAGIAPLPLLLLLFPNGRPPSPRWRWLPPAFITVIVIGLVGTFLRPGRVDVNPGVRPLNPYGVESLRDVLPSIMLVAGVLSIVLSLLPVLALIRRFRAAADEERQQIRWLAYVGVVGAALFVATMLTSVGLSSNESSTANDVSFYAFFAVIGIGIPAAIGISILRYRLWDLDLVIRKTVVFAVVAAFITVVYAVVLLAVPALIVGGERAFSPLTLVTTVVVALLFQPVRARARHFADRLVYGKRATPYEVLSEFSERLSDAYSTDDVLPRMAQLLAAGSGAETVTIWLLIGGELRSVASWPRERRPTDPRTLPAYAIARQGTFEVRHQGDLLGAITVETPANDPLDPRKERLIRDLASQAGLVLRNVRLIEELRRSRRRIVAAVDENRRRLERNIHDGAQQQLVALAVKLRLADAALDRDPAKTHALLAQLQAEANDALEDLRDLARGIYPPLLADEGLAMALQAQARRSPVPVHVAPDGIGRYAREVEASVYFCVLEALQNVAKYAEASNVEVGLRQEGSLLAFEVRDDGVGFDPLTAPRGSGLQGMADRIEAVGGAFELRSAPGRGTTVSATIPVESA